MRVNVVVVGAGQAGLSAAYHLRRTGLEPETDYVVLDDAPGPGGAWQHRWPSLTIGSAHGLAELPELPLPDVDPQRSAAEVVPDYFARYEAEEQVPVHRPEQVRRVRNAEPAEADPSVLVVETDKGRWFTRGLINATGTWQRPFWPTYPGRSTFRGRQLHTHDYRSATEFMGQHVIVVGGGASAVQHLLEISRTATTTWVTREPPAFGAHFHEAALRAAVARVEAATRAGLLPPSVVSVTGLPLTEENRRGIASGVLHRLPMFERIVPDGVMWGVEDVPPAPKHMKADTILWATGFRPSLDHLAPLRLRTPQGGVLMDGPRVVADPRIQLVGYGPTASTIGANRAGRVAVRNLRQLLGF